MYQRIVAQRGHVLFGQRDGVGELFDEATRSDFEPSVLLRVYFGQLLALADQWGVRVVFVLMPINESSLAAMPDSYRADVEAMFAALATMYPEHTIDGQLWALPDECFGDRSHVNAKGSRIVSQRVRELITSTRTLELP